MAVFLRLYPSQSLPHTIINLFVLLVSIFVFALFNTCDARISLEMLKLRTGSKTSYYSETDSLDLPTLDAYDFSYLAPSSFAQPPTNVISNSPINSPRPNPYGVSPIPDPPSAGPISGPNDPVGVHPGPTQPISQPSGAPRHSSGRDYALWCVARPTVPEAMIQRAMDYACGNGADCSPVRPNGRCFVPNNLVAHASYAFNSYWQRTKVAGGTCDFGGTAMLITVDPSFKGCQFLYI